MGRLDNMGAAGIIAGMGAHASALMLNGLFSGVNFIAVVLKLSSPEPIPTQAERKTE